MKIEAALHRIKGNVAEIVFDPEAVEIGVGQSLLLREGERGLIVQVVELRTAGYPALLREEFHSLLGFPIFPEAARPKNFKLAVAKIRKLLGWEAWDGWIPGKGVEIVPLSDEEVARSALDLRGNPIVLGRTPQGHPFVVEGRALEKVNIITGMKGSGKSHLAKVLLLELIKRGAACLVFDINREYIRLPGNIIVLEVGGNFKMDIQGFGLGPLLTLLSRFGLPEVSAIYFENRLSRLFEEARKLEEMGRPVPFIGINELIQMAEAGEYYQTEYGEGAGAVNRTIKSRLEALKNTGIFARRKSEAAHFEPYFEKVRKGGAVVLDLSRLSNQARAGFVQAIIDKVVRLAHREAAGEEDYPFLFFEEAHLYISGSTIDFLVSRARHLGLTLFFITNMITGLEESVLRQADNLFLFNLPLETDINWVAKSALADQETIESLVTRLRRYHCLVIGEATSYYPLILAVDPLRGVETGGETKYFFKPKVQLELFR